jgi:acetone carboxylase gamma subunit
MKLGPLEMLVEKASVGKCDCNIGMCTHRTNCRINPLKIALEEMDKAVKAYPNNVYATKIWNEAIEAAAVKVSQCAALIVADEIRKLKK